MARTHAFAARPVPTHGIRSLDVIIANANAVQAKINVRTAKGYKSDMLLQRLDALRDEYRQAAFLAKLAETDKSDNLFKQGQPVTANKRRSAAVVPDVTTSVTKAPVAWFVTVKGAAVRFESFVEAQAFFLANETFGARRPVKIG